jgi:aminotransferase
VAVVPGSAFGESGNGYIRACYAVSMEKLDLALQGMARFLGK